MLLRGDGPRLASVLADAHQLPEDRPAPAQRNISAWRDAQAAVGQRRRKDGIRRAPHEGERKTETGPNPKFSLFFPMAQLFLIALALLSLAGSMVSCGGRASLDADPTDGSDTGGVSGSSDTGGVNGFDTGGTGVGGTPSTQDCDTAPELCARQDEECLERVPGEEFCGSDHTRYSCAPDRVTRVELEKCSSPSLCVEDADGTSCVDDCAEENRACDPLSTCTNTLAGPHCGACPSGYVGDGVDGCAPLLLDLTLSSGTLSPALSPTVTQHEAKVPFFSQTISLTPSVPDGATVSIEGTAVAFGTPWTSPTLNLGDNSFELIVSQSGHPSRSYVLTVTRGSQEAYIKASNTGAGDQFGWSVALSSDGNTLAIGAPAEASAAIGIGGNQADNSAHASGAVYVFGRVGGAWVQQAYVKASNTGSGARFGVAVALSSDGNTLAVGARGEASSAAGVDGNQADDSAYSAGAVYLFRRTGSTWSQQAYVKASNTEADDWFGYAVALSSDGDTLAVGAYQEASSATGVDGDQADNSASYAGAVYVFSRAGGTWSQQAYVKASNTKAGDLFGNAVVLSSDGNTLAVGASHEASSATGVGGDEADDSASGAGAVYVFTRVGSSWAQQAYVKASNTRAGDRFGASVELSSDGDTLAVGAYDEDSSATGVGGDEADDSATDAGAVYVFTRAGGTWAQQAYAKASNTEARDRFGWAVALSGGGNTLAVGAPGEDSSATGIGGDEIDNSVSGAGAVYVFTRVGSTWAQRAYVKTAGTRQFGGAVTLSGDGHMLAVGAWGEASGATGIGGNQADTSAYASGAAYVFY